MIDRVELEVEAGRGGDGAVSLHREKFVTRGGPDGGDGGRGGHVIAEVNPSLRSLERYRHRPHQRAGHGGNGGPNKKRGKHGADLKLPVPPGTLISVVHDDGSTDVLGDLVEPRQKLRVATGGYGGWGNTRFATATRRTPRFAERGLPGEKLRIRLELKLIADVGIIGLPNAGKSTLLSVISAARPRIGDYPFTTLEPGLGVVDRGYERIIVADIPGVIEGAHEGAGLGLDFLRHIERTAVLLHVIDGAGEDAEGAYRTVRGEMEQYGRGLTERPEVVAINKLDIESARERLPETRAALARAGVATVFEISAGLEEGLEPLLEALFARVRELREEEALAAGDTEPEVPVFRLRGREEPVVERDRDGAFVVSGDRAVTIAQKLDVRDWQARREVVDRLRRLGVVRKLEAMGIAVGDIVRIGESEWEWEG